MKVKNLNYSDSIGGASRAVFRLHKALLSAGVQSTMNVATSNTEEDQIEPRSSNLSKLLNIVRPIGGNLPGMLFKTENPVIHSPAYIRSNWPSIINQSDADIVHLHWFNAEMLSISDITRINKPIIWTLHDMWAFCGAEHLAWDERYIHGYTKSNRPEYESGFDLNRWTWKRKVKSWKKPIHIVTPSKWLSECVSKSYLMKDWPVSVIPNTLDTETWKPINRRKAKKILDLNPDKALLVFGALGGTKSLHKGADLLFKALNHLDLLYDQVELLVFGENKPEKLPDIRFPIHYIGHLNDDISLQVVYSAADALIIPSRQDNLPNGGLEAHACGAPVIAFDTCGLVDIVTHKKTGWLANAFDPVDLANGILWVLDSEERQKMLSENARIKALNRWSYEKVVPQYIKAYQRVLNSTKDSE